MCKKAKYQQIGIWVSEVENEKLAKIIEKYEFESKPKFLLFLMYSFFKSIDRHSKLDTAYNDIEESFEALTPSQSKDFGEKPKRRCNSTIDGINRL